MKTSTKKTPITDSQVQAFRHTARDLGCDESEAAFDVKLGQIAHASVPRKPVKRPKTAKPAKPKKPAKAAAVQALAKRKIRFNLPGA